MSAPQPIPCAIYTRKSSSEGLDMEFNSLDAQREAAGQYIASQRGEGLYALPEHYDDGGFTGGNVERPALQRLLQDIEAGKIKCVVVYKVDRLSRSLMDFAKLMEVFERHGVSFISVTQQFNTTSSMGRLTLNILLSFAQFEREVIGERIRDKIAMQKARGQNTGGVPPLGYDVIDSRLVVNSAEAATVQHIFQRFAQCGSVTQTVKELTAGNLRTKSWTTTKGRVRIGRPFDKTGVLRLLNNKRYLGVVTHRGHEYPGEHEALIDRDLWNQVQSILTQDARPRANHTRVKSTHLLRGLLRCGHCGYSMMATYSRKQGRTYQYYLCGQASKRGHDACPLKSISSQPVEAAVTERVRLLLTDPAVIAQTAMALRDEGEELDTGEATKAINSLGAAWESLFPAEQSRLVKLLVDRIEVRTDGLNITFRDAGLTALTREMLVAQATNG